MTDKKSIKLLVLGLLLFQNSAYTVLRRYSQGVRKETCSKHEILLLAELIKIAFAGYMVSQNRENPLDYFQHLALKSSKMLVLALIYGLMNIISFVALQNIGAGTFTVFAQLKILTTAIFSSVMLARKYTTVQWRAMFSLMISAVLFSEPIWNKQSNGYSSDGGNALLGTIAVVTEVTLSGFASIYFEKVIKSSTDNFDIWERNFQLALTSLPVYVLFIIFSSGENPKFSGWSFSSVLLSILGAAGGLLVALSIKYADAILKTLATSGAIVLSSIFDKTFLGGPLTPIMSLSGTLVIISICDYTFDPTNKASYAEQNPEKEDYKKVDITENDEAEPESETKSTSKVNVV